MILRRFLAKHRIDQYLGMLASPTQVCHGMASVLIQLTLGITGVIQISAAKF